MTRKDYVLIADAMKRARPVILNNRGPLDMWESCVDELAQALARSNPRFDAQRFINACRAE